MNVIAHLSSIDQAATTLPCQQNAPQAAFVRVDT